MVIPSPNESDEGTVYERMTWRVGWSSHMQLINHGIDIAQARWRPQGWGKESQIGAPPPMSCFLKTSSQHTLWSFQEAGFAQDSEAFSFPWHETNSVAMQTPNMKPQDQCNPLYLIFCVWKARGITLYMMVNTSLHIQDDLPSIWLWAHMEMKLVVPRPSPDKTTHVSIKSLGFQGLTVTWFRKRGFSWLGRAQLWVNENNSQISKTIEEKTIQMMPAYI